MVYDSSLIEKPFALALYNTSHVKMFFKVPSRFQMDMPEVSTILTERLSDQEWRRYPAVEWNCQGLPILLQSISNMSFTKFKTSLVFLHEDTLFLYFL